MPKETDRLKLPLPLGNENVTRESINRIFEKIDAGVATRESILIPAESDLNSYITEGEYYCPANATVETLLNSPTGEAFHLTVEPHAGVLQTLTTFQPGNLEVFQRNYYFGWGPWNKVPTRDELEVILPQADENAQAAVNVAVKPIIESYSPNLVKNSAALFGLDFWENTGSQLTWTTSKGAKTLKYFVMSSTVQQGSTALLHSESISVNPGAHRFQGVFYTLGMTTDSLRLDVMDPRTDDVIRTLIPERNTDWHRKSSVVTIPAGLFSVKIRLTVSGMGGAVTNSAKGITRIKLSEGSADVPYSAEGDDLALYESSKQKTPWGAL
ncbi:pyocin knob domain-containing protein [Paenibacillus sp. FSL R5-0490]|uniref:pyocin knob domain-containing protein n=1 Tax=unclassified Paenibacillus TaxID=185978 RepID=UPI0030CEFDF4